MMEINKPFLSATVAQRNDRTSFGHDHSWTKHHAPNQSSLSFAYICIVYIYIYICIHIWIPSSVHDTVYNRLTSYLLSSEVSIYSLAFSFVPCIDIADIAMVCIMCPWVVTLPKYVRLLVFSAVCIAPLGQRLAPFAWAMTVMHWCPVAFPGPSSSCLARSQQYCWVKLLVWGLEGDCHSFNARTLKNASCTPPATFKSSAMGDKLFWSLPSCRTNEGRADAGFLVTTLASYLQTKNSQRSCTVQERDSPSSQVPIATQWWRRHWQCSWLFWMKPNNARFHTILRTTVVVVHLKSW